MNWVKTESGAYISAKIIEKLYTKFYTDGAWKVVAEKSDGEDFYLSSWPTEEEAWDELIDLINTLDGTPGDD